MLAQLRRAGYYPAELTGKKNLCFCDNLEALNG